MYPISFSYLFIRLMNTFSNLDKVYRYLKITFWSIFEVLCHYPLHSYWNIVLIIN